MAWLGWWWSGTYAGLGWRRSNAAHNCYLPFSKFRAARRETAVGGRIGVRTATRAQRAFLFLLFCWLFPSAVGIAHCAARTCFHVHRCGRDYALLVLANPAIYSATMTTYYLTIYCKLRLRYLTLLFSTYCPPPVISLNILYLPSFSVDHPVLFLHKTRCKRWLNGVACRTSAAAAAGQKHIPKEGHCDSVPCADFGRHA